MRIRFCCLLSSYPLSRTSFHDYHQEMHLGKKLSVAFVLGLLSLATFSGGAFAQEGEQIKPYVLVIFDVSGSMGSSTNQGPNSCSGSDNRMDHAKCAMQQVVDAHADIQFGMGRFRVDATPGNSCANCGNNGAINCQSCNGGSGSNGNPAVCPDSMRDSDRFQLLVPFVEDANDAIHEWVNFNCGSSGCTLDPSDNPEIRIPGGSSYTPLGGSLRGARRFFQGDDPNISDDAIDNLDAIYGGVVDDPIGQDPLNDTFIADGQQCRPYIVVLLTDGAETCEVFDVGGSNDDTVGAAADLLSTPYTPNGNTYRIETKPIGFGINPGNSQIEAMAHAGGAEDVVGENEGLYANSETELINAFNQIIADSVLVEICDEADNDCDGAIDEGFQLYCDVENGIMTPTLCADPGDPCGGGDNNCVQGTVDETVNACGQCGPVPPEVCNLSDDDCDGLVDENGAGGSICNGCVPVGQEICNNQDEDCDGNIDEGITQPCGTDVGECTAGIETCVAGVFENCTAIDGSDEECDGLDNDCDGTIDGFVEECSEIPGNTPPYNGTCQIGFKVCEVPPDGSNGNTFGDCQGEVGPSLEGCDELDNDCDTIIDEDTGGANCDSACGVGVTVCTEGVLKCTSEQVPQDEESCNGLDDDCDGVVDENVPDPVPNSCTEGDTLCVPGVLQCIGGGFVCTGGEAPGIEVCDCLDNDCDDKVDEEPPGLCPSGSSCVDCQCAFPCADSEFPCPSGYLCSEDKFCVVNKCFEVECGPDSEGNHTTCVEGACIPSCTLNTNCAPGTTCHPDDGTCQYDDCRGFPERCTDGQLCVGMTCKDDLCSGINCPTAGEYCLAGNCVSSCSDVTCADGEVCDLGTCKVLPCGGCRVNEICTSSGLCEEQSCTVACLANEVCDFVADTCVQDPCLGVSCPGKQVCDNGSCFAMGHGVDAGPAIDHQYVSPGGGGCSSGGHSNMAGMLLVLLLAIRMRRKEGNQ